MLYLFACHNLQMRFFPIQTVATKIASFIC